MSKHITVICTECKCERKFSGETEWHIIAAIKAAGWIAAGRFALCRKCATGKET